MVPGKGISVDKTKIEVVVKWSKPCNVNEVQSFVGLVAYYRKFVEGSSSISPPMMKFTRKNARFLGTDECEKSFQSL